MQKSYLYFLAIMITLLVIACDTNITKDGNDPIKNSQGIIMPDTIFSDNYGYALSENDKKCLADSQNLICEFGLANIAMLGFPMDELDLPAELMVQDTLYTQGGYQWRGKELFFSDSGKIFLEGNFVQEGDPTNQLPISNINRIRVETSLFQTTEGIRVGQTFGELKSILKAAKFEAIYIPSEKMVDLTVSELTGLHFNLRLSLEVEMQEGFLGKEIESSLIPDETRLHSIVVAF